MEDISIEQQNKTILRYYEEIKKDHRRMKADHEKMKRDHQAILAAI